MFINSKIFELSIAYKEEKELEETKQKRLIALLEKIETLLKNNFFSLLYNKHLSIYILTIIVFFLYNRNIKKMKFSH